MVLLQREGVAVEEAHQRVAQEGAAEAEVEHLVLLSQGEAEAEAVGLLLSWEALEGEEGHCL